MTRKRLEKFPAALSFNHHSLARGYQRLSGKKEYVNTHRTRTLEVIIVYYNAKKQWLE